VAERRAILVTIQPGPTTKGTGQTKEEKGLTRQRAGEKALTLDVPEYFVAELGRIMGILSHILRAA
jgi:hypothetical protein